MLRRRKHGTTGRLALPHQHRRYGEIAEAVRSAPGRDPRMARFIRILSVVARESGEVEEAGPRAGSPRRLDTSGPSGVFRADLSARSPDGNPAIAGYCRKPLKYSMIPRQPARVGGWG
jgi:hypothetical protein